MADLPSNAPQMFQLPGPQVPYQGGLSQGLSSGLNQGVNNYAQLRQTGFQAQQIQMQQQKIAQEQKEAELKNKLGKFAQSAAFYKDTPKMLRKEIWPTMAQQSNELLGTKFDPTIVPDIADDAMDAVGQIIDNYLDPKKKKSYSDTLALLSKVRMKVDEDQGKKIDAAVNILKATPEGQAAEANSAKPLLRMNPFTGQQEWFVPPTPGQAPPGAVMPPMGGSAHGPGTYKDVSTASGQYAEEQSMVNSVLTELDRIRPLNLNSHGGWGGAGIQKIESGLNIGTESPKFKNTADVINTLRAQVSRVLKSTFGGQLSDSERDYLNKVYGAAETMSPKERDIAISIVSTMLSDKAKASQAKLSALQSGGQPGAAQAGAIQPMRKTLKSGRVAESTDGGQTWHYSQ